MFAEKSSNKCRRKHNFLHGRVNAFILVFGMSVMVQYVTEARDVRINTIATYGLSVLLI
jgi:hypothetical protein